MVKKLLTAIDLRRKENTTLGGDTKKSQQQRKLDICNTCPFNSKNQKNSIRKYLITLLNKALNKIFKIKKENNDVCLKCGCDIFFKTSDEVSKDLQCKLWEK